jgi:hypothetical protein
MVDSLAMNLSRILAPILLLLITTPQIGCFAGGSNGIVLNSKLRNSNLKVGDEFSLDINIANNGNHNIRILPWMGPYEYGWFTITDTNGKPVENSAKAKFELDPKFPYQNDYVLLSPNTAHKIKLTGRILKDKINTGEKGVFDGVVLDFQNSAVLLGNFSEYYIQVTFTNDEYVKNEAKKKFNFDDMWQGEISSEKISFKVSPNS